MFDLSTIRQRLQQYQGEIYPPNANTRQAAVAVILREADDGLEILFIKRSETPGDPWSGHMAFPGGHEDPEDEDLKQAAVRETLEEIGLDLSAHDYLGALDHQRAMARGRELDMLIAPHVFEVRGDPSFTLNYEVDEVVWAPMARMLSNELHATETKPMAGKPTIFNGYRLTGGHFVWGLTYRMLKQFFLTLDPNWDPPVEIE
ncbi:MAG: CoA pyrophosphatase [Gammaproteobacteria bacterium]|nr:CoA pyrophosphatase [Gammaproteobacteria bacterium]